MPTLKKPNFGMKKRIIVKQSDGSDYEILLEYNAMTPIYYMNFLCGDMLSDFLKATMPMKDKDIKGIDFSKIKDPNDVLELDDEKRQQLFDLINENEWTNFLSNFIRILFYTANCKDNNLTFEDTIDYLPDDFLYNQEITKAVNEILECKLIDNVKKKIIQKKI